MRSTTALFCLLFVTLASFASAEVVKPENTIAAAQGTAKINSTDFTYSVADRGWHAFGNNQKAEAIKSFLIDYRLVEANADQSFLNESVAADAAQKCEELGRLELPGQSKDLPADWSAEVSSSIVNSNTRIYQDKFAGVFVCVVKVTATSASAAKPAQPVSRYMRPPH